MDFLSFLDLFDKEIAMATAKEIFDRQMAEKRYQNQATNFGNYSEGGTGSPTRQATKAKYTMSQTFDGETLTNTDEEILEDGSKTKVVTTQPASIFDMMDEQQNYEVIAEPSIAQPVVVEPEIQEDVDEYSEIITAPGGQKMVWSNRHNGYIPYDDYLEGTKQIPQYTDLSMFDMSMADGPESRLGKAKNTGTNDSEEDLNVSTVQTPYQEGTKEDYIAWSAQSAYNDLLNKEAALTGSYSYLPDPHSGDYDSILEEDAKVFENIDEADGSDDDLVAPVIVDALKEIKKQDPSGASIKVLNDFATWADQHTDAEAEKEAEDYLQALKDSPTVDQKLRKAMAIAMMAMLFGDDFTTAMNTGFGVVADDYAADALEAKTKAEAEAELAKQMAKEQRDFAYDSAKSQRDFEEAVALKAMEQDAKTTKEKKAAEAKRLKDNVDLGAKVLQEMIDSVKGLDEYANSGLAGQSVTQQMAGFMAEIEASSPDGFKLDLYDNQQMYAMSGALENFIHQSLYYNSLGAPDAKAYAQEMFTKLEVEKYTDISPNIISPTHSYLAGGATGKTNHVPLTKLKGEEQAPMHYVDPATLVDGTRTGHKMTLRLGTLVQEIAKLKTDKGNAIGEETLMLLLQKDYEDYRRFQPQNFRRNEKMAYNKGVGPFTRFVLTELAGKTNDTLGINFDTVLQKSSIKDRNTVLKKYLADNSKIKT